MTIIGIDPSLSCTAVCATLMDDPRKVETKVFGSQPHSAGVHNRMARFLRLSEAVVAHARQYAARLVVLEGYAINTKTQFSVEIIEYGSLLRVALCRAFASVIEVPPLSLKKFVLPQLTQDRQEDHAQFCTTIEGKFGHVFTTPDEYYAFGCAWFGLGYVATVNRTLRQQDAINSVRKLETGATKPKKKKKSGKQQ